MDFFTTLASRMQQILWELHCRRPAYPRGIELEGVEVSGRGDGAEDGRAHGTGARAGLAHDEAGLEPEVSHDPALRFGPDYST